MYLSQLLNKPVYKEGKFFGKVTDMAIFENRPNPPISKFEIKKGTKKITVSPHAVALKNNRFYLQGGQVTMLPYDNQDFYLAEDLLDKQVIDVDGKRLVRVNDILLEGNGEIKVMGIDVGTGGILRRLGISLPVASKVLPWGLIEAFDYDTGNIRIKLTQHSLSTLHPADIADILEEAGSKERVGIVTALDAKKAAMAIEESNEETQASILEELPSSPFKEIVGKMHSSEIADLFRFLNPIKKKEIQTVLLPEKVQKIRKALSFNDDVAGGIMRLGFFTVNGNTTVKEAIKLFSEKSKVPETIIVTNESGKISGIVYSKELLRIDRLAQLKDIINEKKYVYPDAQFPLIMKLFSQYNLRCLPVVDKEKKPIGIIIIDDLLRIIEEEEERYESH